MEGFIRLRDGGCTHRNTLESIPLESRPHRSLEIDLVCIEGDQMVIPESLCVEHTFESNILTS